MLFGRFLSALSPIVRWSIVWLLCGVLFLVTCHFALSQPQSHTELQVGMTLKSKNDSIVLQELDFISEPGDIPTYPEFSLFLSRQDQILKIIADSEVESIHNGEGRRLILTKRTFADLPLGFWIQIIVAVGGILISGWIWSLKVKDLGPVFFFLSGISMGVSALSSAVYTTRSTALPASWHLFLEAFNSLGASGFGIFMIALFVVYPVKLPQWKKIISSLSVIFTVWTFLTIFQVIPRTLGLQVIILLLMLLIIAAIAIQFFKTKGDPKSKAALTWLGLSVLTGSGGWVMANTLPLLWGAKPVDQSYAFITFLIIYIGLAAGLYQYRLFDVGQWAYRFLFYAMGAIAIALFDATLIYIGMGRLPALGLSLMLVGFLYLPLRDLLWRRFSLVKSLGFHELLDHALHVAFAPHPNQRLERWHELLNKIFKPLETEKADELVEKVKISADGVTLYLPAVAGAAALKLHYPYGGRSLFNSQLIATAKSLVSLIEEAETSRDAYDRGVSEERLRIAQDLHDNVGARLLTGLHAPQGDDVRETIRHAISDIRIIVKGISGQSLNFTEALAELRIEAHRRLTGAGIELEWPVEAYIDSQLQVEYPFYKAVDSCLKELISNAIKHSKANRVEVKISVDPNELRIMVEDNGIGIGVESAPEAGFGLKSLNNRIRQFNGDIVFSKRNGGGTLVEIKMPVV